MREDEIPGKVEEMDLDGSLENPSTRQEGNR